MDSLRCAVGALREEAQRTAAIGARTALDKVRLSWTSQAQMQYEAAQKTADEALTAWNEHIRTCTICRNVHLDLVQASTKPELVAAPSILLVDDNHALLESLAGMLQHTYRILGSLSNGADVVERAATLVPDLILLDISLGDISGFEIARRLKKTGCTAKIVFLTLHEDMDFADAAFRLGASGYVLKSRLGADLERALACVLSGGQFSSIS